jgi:hypothetical protein
VSLEYNGGAEGECWPSMNRNGNSADVDDDPHLPGYTMNDEELWNAVLGVGDECSAYHSLKKWASFSESST